MLQILKAFSTPYIIHFPAIGHGQLQACAIKENPASDVYMIQLMAECNQLMSAQIGNL